MLWVIFFIIVRLDRTFIMSVRGRQEKKECVLKVEGKRVQIVFLYRSTPYLEC